MSESGGQALPTLRQLAGKPMCDNALRERRHRHVPRTAQAVFAVLSKVRRRQPAGVATTDTTLHTRSLMTHRLLAIAALLSMITLPAHAQRSAPAADRDAVRAAVLDYVEGFYEGDTARLMRSVWPEVRKYGYARDAALGTYRGMAMAFPTGFVNYAEGVKAGRTKTPVNAPKEITIFDVQDQTASAKLTAWWGTDYLLLAKENGRWMITHVLWQNAPPGAAR